MLQAFKQFLSELSGGEKRHLDEDGHRLAAAALLVHAAMIDGVMSGPERARLQAALMQRFDLDEAAADELIAAATTAEQEAIDLYAFTSLLNRSLDEAGRLQIVEMMWQVAYADGRITEFEDNLIWRAADLLHVPSRARIELRQRVADACAGGTRGG